METFIFYPGFKKSKKFHIQICCHVKGHTPANENGLDWINPMNQVYESAIYIECDIKNTWPICNYEFKRIGHTFIALYIGYDTKSKWPIRNYEFKRIGRPLIALYIGCDTKSKWSIRTYGFKRIDRTFYFYAHWLGYRKQIANP